MSDASSRTGRDQRRVGQAAAKRAETPDAHRRRPRGGSLGRRVRQRQPRHRARAGHHRRRRRRTTWTGRSPRRGSAFDDDRLVDEPRAAQAMPASNCSPRWKPKSEDLRDELVAEVGCPVMTTRQRAARLAAGRVAALPGAADRRLRMGAGARRRRPVRRPQRAHGRQGAGRRRRRDHAVQLPHRGHPQQARARRWRRATPLCSNPIRTRRGTPPDSGG